MPSNPTRKELVEKRDRLYEEFRKAQEIMQKCGESYLLAATAVYTPKKGRKP